MKATALTAVLASIVAMIIGLGIWFAPTHGQPNEDVAQLIDVRVVDDAGGPVVGAPVAVERFDGGRWVNTRRGGASDAAGEQSVEMPTAQGRYRIVLTVPQGYSEDHDDADGSRPGPNNECAGMVNRCVAYSIDAAGTVTLPQPAKNSTGTSVTFHVKRDVIPTLLTVTQKDVNGRAVHGGTFVMRPFRIVEVNGQKVRQWGRTSRTGMTTSSRTFRVDPNTSYSISWEPPEGYLKVTPGAPSFGYEITTGPKGTTTRNFTVRQPGALGESVGEVGGSGAHDGGGTEHVPGGAQQVDPPEAPADEPEQPADQPQQGSSTPDGTSQSAVPTEPGTTVAVTVDAPSDSLVVSEPEEADDPADAETETSDVVDDEVVAEGEPVDDEVVTEVEVVDTDETDEEVIDETIDVTVESDADLAAEIEAELNAEWGEEDAVDAALDAELEAELAAELGLEDESDAEAAVEDDRFEFDVRFDPNTADT